MPYLTGLIDARPLRLVALPTHRCRTCGSPVRVDRVDASTFGDVARRHQVFVWGRHWGCVCGSTDRPEPLMGDDFLTWGRLEWWAW